MRWQIELLFAGSSSIQDQKFLGHNENPCRLQIVAAIRLSLFRIGRPRQPHQNAGYPIRLTRSQRLFPAQNHRMTTSLLDSPAKRSPRTPPTSGVLLS